MTLPGQAGEPATPEPGDPGEPDRTAIRGIPFDEIAAAAAIFKVLGTFGDAYLSRLGQMLAESTPAILKRIRLRRNPVHDTGRLMISTDHSTIAFEFDGDLSDDAKLALIDIDLTDGRLQGATLRWNAATGQWHEA
ncbi:MAG: hypothetical protein ACRDOI_44630 [Trebonia sp.]